MEKWYSKLWIKILCQIAVMIILFLFYLAIKYLIPKKYRLNDRKLRDLVTFSGVVMSNFVKPEDGLSEILGKSKNVMLHFQDKKMQATSSAQELKYLLDNEELEYDLHKDWGFMKLLFPKLEKYGYGEAIQEVNAFCHICRFTFDDVEGKKVIFYLIKNFSPSAEESNYEQQFGCTKGFDYHTLAKLLFKNMNGIYLSASHNGTKLNLSKLDFEKNTTDYLFDEELYQTLQQEITKFKKKNVQRSYIIYGPPGTGKSSFCFEISKRATGKVLKLDSTIFTNLSNAYVKDIIKNLDCDFIIVDDIDRIKSSSVPEFLYSLETMKHYESMPTLFATVNNLNKMDAALIRPGRFDDIIEFPAPTLESRKIFITKMLEVFQVAPLTEEQLTKFAEITNGLTEAYLKEYCQQLRIEVDFDVMINKIIKRQKLLEGRSLEELGKTAIAPDSYDDDHYDD